MSTKKKTAPKNTAAKVAGAPKKTAKKVETKANVKAKAMTGKAEKPAPAKAEIPSATKATPEKSVESEKANPRPATPPAPVKNEKKLSLLSAAYEVLASDNEALSVRAIVKLAKDRGLWTPGAGKTPEQTLYSAIMREINAKGETSRFTKATRGLFKARV